MTQFSSKRIEPLKNGLQPHSGRILSVSIDFNESFITSAILRSVDSALMLTLDVNEPLDSCDVRGFESDNGWSASGGERQLIVVT